MVDRGIGRLAGCLVRSRVRQRGRAQRSGRPYAGSPCHAALCWIFARTLASGRTPLCTEFASWVHEDMSSPRLLWYTRQVTNAWAIFFALTAVASVVLFVYAQPSVWTFFSAVLGPALTAAVFVVENLLRSYFLPPKDRVGLAGTWRAVQARIQDQRRTRAAPRTP